MDNLLESIRVALSTDANDETRAAGAHACRTILAALDAKAGEAMTPAASDTAAPSASAEPIAQVVAALRGVPAEQLLDLAITRLRAALPTGVEAPRVEPLKFHIVRLPAGRRP